MSEIKSQAFDSILDILYKSDIPGDEALRLCRLIAISAENRQFSLGSLDGYWQIVYEHKVVFQGYKEKLTRAWIRHCGIPIDALSVRRVYQAEKIMSAEEVLHGNG